MSHEIRLKVKVFFLTANEEPSEEVRDGRDGRDCELFTIFDSCQSPNALIFMKDRLVTRFGHIFDVGEIRKIVRIHFGGEVSNDVETAEDVAQMTEYDSLMVYVNTDVHESCLSPPVSGNTYRNLAILLSHQALQVNKS